MLPGRERENLSYGGKIIMPPSALANLTNLDLESPWMFKLRNPSNPAASTHAGVLEFIAEEGVVHLPYWMMKTLRLNEGDPIRITGTELPKGKLVKLQAQSVHFLEIGDHKAVLEQAFRNFSCLTQGDIIEIAYNSMIFGILVMETNPGGEGISVLDADLEVDFAAPVGYVEPERPKAAPPATMASKLKIDLNETSPGISRPGSAGSGAFAPSGPASTSVSKGGDHWESFKGKGQTLAGRKTKGRGISHRAAEQVPDDSKIIRTDKHKVVTTESLDSDVKVPAALNLPFGKLFFGFNVAAYTPPPASPISPSASSPPPVAFGGSGQTLNGRPTQSQATAGSSKGKEKAKEEDEAPKWGTGGHTLGGVSRAARPPVSFNGRDLGAGGAAVPQPPSRRKDKQKSKKQRSPSPEMDWGVDDDDVIHIDSD
ncbi:hypothetical protein HWV62_15189 [Athelia sp. TMB]|nr:hypothetical protein HWV62_15189 [Athelia sp. TMB]